MKYLLKTLSLVIVIASLSSCTVENIDESIAIEEASVSNLTCTDSNPEARFVNNGTVAYTFRIINIDNGNTISIFSIQPGSTTSWNSFTEGDVVFSIEAPTDVNTGVSDMKKGIFMANCTTIEIAVDGNNDLIDSLPVEL